MIAASSLIQAVRISIISAKVRIAPIIVVLISASGKLLTFNLATRVIPGLLPLTHYQVISDQFLADEVRLMANNPQSFRWEFCLQR